MATAAMINVYSVIVELEYLRKANLPKILYNENPNPAPSPNIIAFIFHKDGLKGSSPETRQTPINVTISEKRTTRVIASLNKKKDRIVTKAGAVYNNVVAIGIVEI